MKRITAMLFCLLMALNLVGCGGQEGNEIAALLEEGYRASSTILRDSKWAGIMQKDGSWDSVYIVTAAMTEEQMEAYMSLDYETEDREAKEKALFAQLTDVTVMDISDKTPTQEELDAYIGMTLGDLEAEGFARTGYVGYGESRYDFLFDSDEYCLNVTPKEAIGNPDNCSEDELRSLTIAGVEFTGFDFQLLEEASR